MCFISSLRPILPLLHLDLIIILLLLPYRVVHDGHYSGYDACRDDHRSSRSCCARSSSKLDGEAEDDRTWIQNASWTCKLDLLVVIQNSEHNKQIHNPISSLIGNTGNKCKSSKSVINIQNCSNRVYILFDIFIRKIRNLIVQSSRIVR